MRCPNCDQPIAAAPWRYDDAEHGVHWVCPGADVAPADQVFGPIPLSEAIADYLQDHPHAPPRVRLIGEAHRGGTGPAAA